MPVNLNESTKKVKLDLSNLSNSDKERALEAAGEILVEEINIALDASRSPVRNGKYKARKKDNSPSQLFDEGDMRSQITFETIAEENAVMVGIFESAPDVERKKAYNHNVGDTLPQRRFIPGVTQNFKKPIMDKVNRAIKEIRAEAKEREKEEESIVEENVIDVEVLIQEILGS